MKNIVNKQKGYTLLELLIVLLGVLSIAVMILAFTLYKDLLPGVNPMLAETGAGFLKGLFHGSFAIFFLIASLFTDVGVYEVHNNGFFYNFGYLFIYMMLALANTNRRR